MSSRCERRGCDRCLVRPLVPFFLYHDQRFKFRRVFVDGDLPRTGRRRDEDFPMPLAVGKIHKIRFVVDLEVHFDSSLFRSSFFSSSSKAVILSEDFASRMRSKTAVEGPHACKQRRRLSKEFSHRTQEHRANASNRSSHCQRTRGPSTPRALRCREAPAPLRMTNAHFFSSTSSYSASITPSSFFAPAPAPLVPGSGPAPGVGPVPVPGV